MATMGWLSRVPPVEPSNGAPNAKMPPSEETSQYPPVALSTAMLTMGWFSFLPPIEPRNGAEPYEKTAPSAAVSQYPLPSGAMAIDTIGGGGGCSRQAAVWFAVLSSVADDVLQVGSSSHA